MINVEYGISVCWQRGVVAKCNGAPYHDMDAEILILRGIHNLVDVKSCTSLKRVKIYQSTISCVDVSHTKDVVAFIQRQKCSVVSATMYILFVLF